ncbi:MAG: phosphotransferase family protein [Pseudomonadota bacterium]
MADARELPDALKPNVDLDALADWMDAKGLGRGAFDSVVPLTGGTQNILLRLSRADRDYVFRRPPPNPRKESDEVMRREARVLQALGGTNVPHPGFIAGEPDETVLGYAFLLMEPVDGFNPTEGLPSLHASDPGVRRHMGLSYVEGLAALAEVEADLPGFGKPDGFLERQVPRWLAQLEGYARVDAWPGLDCGVERVAQWLEVNRPGDDRPGLIHGDCHLGNTLFKPGSGDMAALIDWELATLGDPRLDIGWVMATWPDVLGRDTVGLDIAPWDGFPDIDTLVRHYADCTTRPLDSAPWFGVLACFKLGILLEGTYARSLAGKAPKAVGEKLHAATLALFARAERFISAG